MRIKPAEIANKAQQGLSTTNEMINLSEIFERGNRLLPNAVTDGTARKYVFSPPKIRVVKKIVPEVIKETSSETAKTLYVLAMVSALAIWS